MAASRPVVAEAASPSNEHPGAKPSKSKTYPEPFVIPPSSSNHTHTAILLHGQGSNGPRFGQELLRSQTSDGKTLAQHLPGMKFIFPTAKKRRAIVFKRMPINQWFDNHSLKNPRQRQDLQYDGLQETSIFIHSLVMEEARLVGG